VPDEYEDRLTRIVISFEGLEMDIQRKFLYQHYLKTLSAEYDKHTVKEMVGRIDELCISEMTIWFNEQSVISLCLVLHENNESNPGVYLAIGSKTQDPVSKTLLHLEPKQEDDKKAIDLVFSSKRSAPARFSQNHSRTQSFCIDFNQLKKEADEIMAAQAWGAIGYYLTEKTPLEQNQFLAVLKIGEDIMIGAFIATKINEEKTSLLKQKIIQKNTNLFSDDIPNLGRILDADEVQRYLSHCQEFGIDTARNNR